MKKRKLRKKGKALYRLELLKQAKNIKTQEDLLFLFKRILVKLIPQNTYLLKKVAQSNSLFENLKKGCEMS